MNELNSTVVKSKIPFLFIKQLLQLQRELAALCAAVRRPPKKACKTSHKYVTRDHNYDFNLIRDESSVIAVL